ncbi:MAG: sulfite exporter TauE/SafE family protein [Candidatus Altiarchaeota archaeon]
MYGLSSSLTLCLASCLPVYLPILLGYGDNPKKGFTLSIGFAVGRFFGYFILGIIAALIGAAFLDFFESTFPSISTNIVLVFGLLTIVFGFFILSKTEISVFGNHRCKVYFHKVEKFNNPLIGAGFLGFVSTITPCVPVFTFLLLPFAMGKVWETSIITVFFGLGANVVFVVIGLAIALGMKNVKERFLGMKRGLEVASGVTLIIFGIFYVVWSLGPMVFGWGNQSFILPSYYDLIDLVQYLLS